MVRYEVNAASYTAGLGYVEAAKRIGYPVVLRPAFTLGGTGGGFADDETQLREMMRHQN